ncbi:AfsA-related hotdog domain-containing protein [Caldimonas brevitalea]|uniref:A-factor biosynthesis hotdog domain-containing protein n=1 Tax=Caldimonas brevitalea TaxID=413882 RepID=A0A0G3BJV7_9BURK|nr:AfsA-related hotdog domain-containing protein [Caldimonas brevitalea]AKJ29754.1 hypothetical protein AAW51_3063 [Caldimonas brevitalea]
MNAITQAERSFDHEWGRIQNSAHQRTIARELAHKRQLESVYVTSLHQLSDSEFLIGAFVPQSNQYINDMRLGPQDVTLSLVEIGRQIGIAVSHEFLGVPHGHAFILDDMRFEPMPAWHSIDWRTAERLWVHMTVRDCKLGAEHELVSVRAEGTFYVGEQCVCRQSSGWTVQPQHRYLRLRELARLRHVRRPPVPQGDEPPLAGGFRVRAHASAARAVIEDTLWVSRTDHSFVGTLRVERDNRFFFDHQNDHVPGLLVLEGMRRLALDVASRYRRYDGEALLREMEVDFTSFAELDCPVYLTARPAGQPDVMGPPERLHVEARQGERLVASSRFLMA